jgi:hypothetical protein
VKLGTRPVGGQGDVPDPLTVLQRG